MGTKKQPVAKMIGYFLREASVLVLVFGFMDMLVNSEHGAPVSERFSTLGYDWIGFILSLSLFLFASGAFLERIRK